MKRANRKEYMSLDGRLLVRCDAWCKPNDGLRAGGAEGHERPFGRDLRQLQRDDILALQQVRQPPGARSARDAAAHREEKQDEGRAQEQDPADVDGRVHGHLTPLPEIAGDDRRDERHADPDAVVEPEVERHRGRQTHRRQILI